MDPIVSGASLPAGHRLQVFEDADALMAGAARALLTGLPAGRGSSRIVLAGGSTPRALYDLLAGEFTGDWDPARMRFTFSDERCVPPDHPDSNYGMAMNSLFAGADGGKLDVLRLRGEDDPPRGAEKAHRAIESGWARRVPLFDTVLLGLGADAHVASLFPEDLWPQFSGRWAAPVQHPDGGWRITLTPAALRSTARTLFLVSGEAKAEAVCRTLTVKDPSPRVPARMVVGRGEALWLLDRAAASSLPASLSGP